MARQREDVVDTVRKLLALADKESGGTIPERDAAAERAQALMLKYAIEQAELDQEAENVIGQFRGPTLARRDHWHIHLLVAIAGPVMVDVLWLNEPRGDRRILYVGRKERVEYVAELYGWLAPHLYDECAVALTTAKRGSFVWLSVQTKEFRRSFYQGACYTIAQRLRDATKGVPGMGLVLSDRARIDDFLSEANINQEVVDDHQDLDVDGLLAGQAAGRAVDVARNSKLGAA